MNKRLQIKWDGVKLGYRMLFTKKEVRGMSDDFKNPDNPWNDPDYIEFMVYDSKDFPGLFVGYIYGHLDPKPIGIGEL